MSAPGGSRGWRWRAGHGGRDAPTWAGGCMTSLCAVPAQAGRPEKSQADTGRSP